MNTCRLSPILALFIAFLMINTTNLSADNDPAEWSLRIEKNRIEYKGSHTILPVYIESDGMESIDEYQLLIEYSYSLRLTSVEPGKAFECWDEIGYEHLAQPGDGSHQGLIRLTGRRGKADNGECSKSAGFISEPTQLVRLKFFVINDRQYESSPLPVNFYWQDCEDNTIKSYHSDRMYVSRQVNRLAWINPAEPYTEYLPPDGSNDYGEDHHFGAWDDCLHETSSIRNIDFFNGMIDINNGGEQYFRGDINLNRYYRDSDDRDLFADYFLYGPGVFDLDREKQVFQSDVDQDGIPLELGDFGLMTRLMSGSYSMLTSDREILNTPKSDMDLFFDGRTVHTESEMNIAAVLLVFDQAAEIESMSENLTYKHDVVGGKLRLLIYGLGPDVIQAGENEILGLDRIVELVEYRAVDYYGRDMNIHARKDMIPLFFELNQNAPNPFNSGTKISFGLPHESKWRLDVYNVRGQIVETQSGFSPAGTVNVILDASAWSSGIYFFRLTADDFSESRKMLLLK